MNCFANRLLHVAVASVLVAGSSVSRAQSLAPVRAPSPSTAGWISLGALLVPTAVSVATGGKELGAAVGFSMLFAPMVGYAYGGIAGRGLAPLGRRLLVLGATAGTAIALCAGDSCNLFDNGGNAGAAAAVGIAGIGIFTVMTVRDVAQVPAAVRENNAKRVAISPAWIPSSRAVGLTMKVGF